MARRMIVMLAVTGLFLTGLGFVKFQQIQTAIAQGAAFVPYQQQGLQANRLMNGGTPTVTVRKP